MAPRGDGHSVLVLPGFTAGDASTGVLRRYLTQLGYDARGWELGRNLGAKAIGQDGEKLVARLEAIAKESGEKVSVVGWSLGGIMARLVAHRAPEIVRQVITLGSPFGGSPRATHAGLLYEWINGEKLNDEHFKKQMAEVATALPVPSTAIYTHGDGIVAWQNCMQVREARTDNVRVHGSHCGLGINPAVLYVVADRLAQPADDWQPFKRTGLAKLIYPAL